MPVERMQSAKWHATHSSADVRFYVVFSNVSSERTVMLHYRICRNGEMDFKDAISETYGLINLENVIQFLVEL